MAHAWLLAGALAGQMVCVVLCWLVRSFYVVVGLYSLNAVIFGLTMPVKAA